METLAACLGDLKHLLTNVKTRGIFGEAQLAGLLEQVFVVDQYAAQVATRPGSKNVVDFAIKLPGKSEQGNPCGCRSMPRFRMKTMNGCWMRKVALMRWVSRRRARTWGPVTR